MVIAALKDLPDTLRDLPDEVSTRLKKPLPSIKVVVNAEEPEEPGTLERIVRRVAPAVVGTASSAVIERFMRTSDSGDGVRAPPFRRTTDRVTRIRRVADRVRHSVPFRVITAYGESQASNYAAALAFAAFLPCSR